MAVDADGRLRSFVWRDRTYTIIKVEHDWETMRPWWKEDLPGPLDDVVRHYQVRASSPKGSGIIEIRQQFEGWYVTGVVD